ncbi:DUF2489 domain-containing protein [Kangiella geojedonensis]|uniref:DUF2489 domain-containing protein n=1 Tax=Kangiella geojedonensis TaxID=914150 RepID=A0A0F6RCL5_9GAMM|nr:DUF2489 domain-containing protein [Kangiella geojedonensis]AKE52146.1 hypothetical protein TQ33_1186 [Kangiella geojedonensis]
MTIFYYVASFITLALIIYAGYLLLKLRKLKAQQKLTADAFAKKQQAQMSSVVESIVDISKAMQQEQCPTIEGCVRLKVLIDQLRLSEEERKPFDIYYTVYDKTEHIPTHKAWTDLEKRQQMKFTRDMMLIEQEHHVEIKTAVDKTVEHFKEVSEKQESQ